MAADAQDERAEARARGEDVRADADVRGERALEDLGPVDEERDVADRRSAAVRPLLPP